MTVPVVTSAQAAALDAASIAEGNPSRALMQRAGAAAAAIIGGSMRDRLEHGVAVFAGPGNNGGDAWVIAAALAAAGVTVRVHEGLAPTTDDARAERERALATFDVQLTQGGERVVVDGLLGTGSSGAPRGAVASAIEQITRMRGDGAAVVALDVPSGLDATTGAAEGAVRADLTLSFGTAKRGQLLNRAVCGRILVLDIGLGAAAIKATDLPRLLDRSWVMRRVPPIDANAHKGDRGRVGIIGSALGMAGATTLAARAALRTGAGLVRIAVEPENFLIAQTAVPQAIASSWPASPERANDLFGTWAHSVVIGPGLGTGEAAQRVFRLVTEAFNGPTAIDADGLNILANDTTRLSQLAASRKLVLTPHVGEMSRLMGVAADEVISQRFDIGAVLSGGSGAVVLLKGVPTIVAATDGRTCVSAAGSPALATGGSGDLLAGILGTLLAQMADPFEAACCAAWLHGRAGELAGAQHTSRGATLDDVINALAKVWSESPDAPAYPVLADIPEIR